MENESIISNNIVQNEQTQNLLLQNVLEEKSVSYLLTSSSSTDSDTLENISNYMNLNVHTNLLSLFFIIAIFIYICFYTISHGGRRLK